MDSALALAREQRRAAREARQWEREKIIYDRVLTPNVVRVGLIAGIIAYSTWAARSPTNVGPVQSALAFALPAIGIPVIAADAGIRDKYALGAISVAAIGYVTAQMQQGWEAAGIGGGERDWTDLLAAGIPPLALAKLLSGDLPA